MRLTFAVLVGWVVPACSPPEPIQAPSPPVAPLHLDPLTDLAPSAALVWLIDVRPRALALDGRVAGPISEFFPAPRLSAFVGATGGIDPRETDELILAAYPATLLVLARQFVDPSRIEAAFTAHLVSVEGRAVDGVVAKGRSSMLRLWGSTAKDHEQVAIFGVDAVGFERGRFGPLRAAELFAQGRLKRAAPALRSAPLERLASLLGEAPVRAFAPGPFQGELEHAVGGLLGASHAVGASARIVDGGTHGRPGVAMHVALLGAWGGTPEAAIERLRAVFDILATSGIGRLFGLSHCLSGPTTQATDEALTLDFTLDAAEFAKGLYAATSADAQEIVAP